MEIHIAWVEVLPISCLGSQQVNHMLWFSLGYGGAYQCPINLSQVRLHLHQRMPFF